MRAALFSCCVLMTGCFYVDPINQRPSIDIRQTSAGEAYRRSTVTLESVANDPEDQLVFRQWRVYACTDAQDFSTCDTLPFKDSQLNNIEFIVPDRRVDVDLPPESLFVILEAKDEYGAIARPRQELIIAVSNRPPTLELSMDSPHGFVVGTDIELYAKVSDDDDGPAGFDTPRPLEWEVFSPMTNPSYTLDELEVPDEDSTKALQLGKTFTPTGIGRWEIRVTATDPLGAKTTESLIVDVVPDQPPCLGQWSPIAAPAGSAWPMTNATLFQVTVVNDDLNPYPTVFDDEGTFEPIGFTWSIRQPGASTWTTLGVETNGVALDPGNYAPGDLVELRVQIEDRVIRQPCADSEDTCSVGSNSCIQRLTWHVEVR